MEGATLQQKRVYKTSAGRESKKCVGLTLHLIKIMAAGGANMA